MSLSVIGFATVILVLVLIITKKASPLVALVTVPTIACLIAGHAADYSSFVVSGLKSVAPTAAMFAFAMIFFNMLIDLGTFDPIVNMSIRFAKNDPVKVMLATILIAIVGHLDGAGSTTFILTIGAMSPIYRKMKLNMTYLCLLTALAAGIMNIVPWGGPTLRAMTALEADASQIFTPMIIPMIGGLLATCGVAVWFGKSESKRLQAEGFDALSELNKTAETAGKVNKLSKKMTIINMLLILVVVFVMIKGILAPAPTMILGVVIAFLLNCREKAAQDAVMNKFAPTIVNLLLVLFSTAVFTGVLSGTGMLDAMALSIANMIPTSLGRFIPVIVGVLSFPMSFLFTPDAYYYSILPTLATAAETFGISSIIIGRASLIGQMTVGFPFSGLNATSYMLPEMVGIEFGDFQKKTIPIGYAVSLVMVVVAVLCGCITI